MSAASEFISAGIRLAQERGRKCPVCEGTGNSVVGYSGLAQIGLGTWACSCAAGQAVQAARQHEASATQREEMLARAQIPDKYAAWDFSTFEARTRKSLEKTKALRLARDWVNQRTRPWLFLFGKTGRGKTGLGAAALRALIGQGRSGRFISTFDMFDEMKQRFGGDVEAYTDALAKIDALMIDEMVPAQVTDWRRGVLFELLWRRDAGQRITIMTTAAGTEVLQNAVTEAGWRRIRENAVMVELGGNEINFGQA